MAHRVALSALSHGLIPGGRRDDDAILACTVWGRDFANPIGLAAGFDKDAEVVAGAFALGFGCVEFGSVTPRPQPGNPRPRLFRLVADRAIVNRMGFNSRGLDAAAARLRQLRAAGGPAGVLGANLAKNRDSTDAAADYVAGIRALANDVDYLVINVSSPNTPGLRDLQRRDALARLLDRTQEALAATSGAGGGPALVLKIAPDLAPGECEDVAAVARAAGVDGMIVGNTTVSRPLGLHGPHTGEAGGLSGRPLFALSTRVLADMYRLTEGRIPLVGCGGVGSGEDAYAKIRAGASLVQLYTALVYEGPGLVGRVKSGLARCMRADGFTRIADAVGADHR
jgi:dihydroorotate dehydrogenase